MKANLVPLDRAIRAGVGLLVLATPLLELHTYPYNLLGLIPLVTGLISFCPLYAAFRALLPPRGGFRRIHTATHG